jgi:hypothetical protein
LVFVQLRRADCRKVRHLLWRAGTPLAVFNA